jgi:cytidylate kinase
VDNISVSDREPTGSGGPNSEQPARGRPLIIAIDGPSGAGKGTIARAVAVRLGYRHVDTGAMYRALAWKALEERTDLSDEPAVAALAGRVRFDVGDGRIRVDGHDVASAIRNPEMDSAAAIVARHPRVREALIARQRQLGKGGGVVMEGRDIGTVVFPAADVKIFLDASPEERARRRATDPAHASGKGVAAIPDVATALAERDRIDRSRPTSPLVQAADAVGIDTTGLSIDEAVQQVLEVVGRAG